MPTPSLDDRIADAFSTQMSSVHLGDLLAEVLVADREAQEDSELAKAIAIDPATRSKEVAAARKRMEDAAFTRLRMEQATSKLQELQSEAAQREGAEKRQQEREAAIAERDQLAKDLKAYEYHAKAIAELMVRLHANTAKVGVGDGAERLARGLTFEQTVNPTDALPSLLGNVQLPKFRRDNERGGFLWPKATW